MATKEGLCAVAGGSEVLMLPMAIPIAQVIRWGKLRRDYDLAHPHGEHETMINGEEYSNRPAFLSHLIVP